MLVDHLTLTPPPAVNTWCADAYPDVITTSFTADEFAAVVAELGGENDPTPDE
jgi:hypothetical protein